jgi:GDP-4-dehydro-6-deoxy-D-mannose reductase
MPQDLQRVVVTGAGGFVGQALCQHLAGEQVATFGIDRRPADTPDRLWVLDLLDEQAVRHALQEAQPSHIFHLAGVVGIQDEAALHAAHVETTHALLTAVARTTPQSRLIILGSAAEYGSKAVSENGLVAEGASEYPESAYGKSKLLQGQIASKLADKLGLTVIRTRLFNTLGPGQGPHLVAGAMVQRLHTCLQNRADGYELFDPHSERDFLDVRDVAKLLWLVALKAKGDQHQFPVHIASGKKTSVLNLAHCLYEVAGVTVEDLPLKLRPSDRSSCFVGEAKTLKTLLNGKDAQTISLKSSLSDMWHWYLKEQNKIDEIAV